MEQSYENGSLCSIAQAIEEIKAAHGGSIPQGGLNLAELGRRTGISRGKLRQLKANGFQECSNHQGSGRKPTKLTGFTGIIDTLLQGGVSNSRVVFERLQANGFSGSLSIVKEYIAAHKHLLPTKRQKLAPQGNRGRRFQTEPGEAYQMDWGFAKVIAPSGGTYSVACFAMICHHCGKMYIEFFPNAKQESLFIGMIHGFQYMGMPQYVLTDNMKSVVLRRNLDGNPVWQQDYEAFMSTLGLGTKLCKPGHPYTKGKVERLVRYIKGNFLMGRSFVNITDLNRQAIAWCDSNNCRYDRKTDCSPQQRHESNCSERLRDLPAEDILNKYLCPVRKVSFDGFITYEGRRFGIPYAYKNSEARVMRKGDELLVFSSDLEQILVRYDVTWNREDRFCEGQYEETKQPEERPTMPVTTQIVQVEKSSVELSFDRFNFGEDT